MTLHEVKNKYGIEFKKSLGQNLLLDDNINRIMVDAAAVTAEDDVVEVGAGLGNLTTHLADRARRVLAVEIDRSFIPVLEEKFGDRDNVVLFRGDILNHDLAKLLDEYLPGYDKLKMVSNLPYYITTPILFHFLESSVPLERLVIMVQEEVARRMACPPGHPEYGVLAIACSYYAEVDIVHKAPRTCFRPQPKVDSCIVRLRTRTEPRYSDVDRKFLFSLVRAAFSQRRKTLRNSLAKGGAFGVAKETVLDAMEVTGIDPGRRPQTLALEEFVELAREIRRGVTFPARFP